MGRHGRNIPQSRGGSIVCRARVQLAKSHGRWRWPRHLGHGGADVQRNLVSPVAATWTAVLKQRHAIPTGDASVVRNAGDRDDNAITR